MLSMSMSIPSLSVGIEKREETDQFVAFLCLECVGVTSQFRLLARYVSIVDICDRNAIGSNASKLFSIKQRRFEYLLNMALL